MVIEGHLFSAPVDCTFPWMAAENQRSSHRSRFRLYQWFRSKCPADRCGYEFAGFAGKTRADDVDESRNQSSLPRNRCGMRSTGWILTAWMLLPLAGCASLTDFHYEQTQRSRARSAWHEHGVATMPPSYASDYRAGWKDGFYDVATGGRGCPPVVAPSHYWKPAQILADCDQARHTYYSGFQDGVAAALQYPDTHYLKLWASCECPLPVCENRCATTICCPGEPCGLIVQDEFVGPAEFAMQGSGIVAEVEAPDSVMVFDTEKVPETFVGLDAVREAMPYQIESEPRDSVFTDQEGWAPETSSSPSERSDVGDAPQPNGVKAAEPYHLDVKLKQRNPLPLDGTPAPFRGRMIEDDLGAVAPCNLLQYTN